MMDSITGACNIIWFVIIEDEFDYDFHCDSNSMPLMASMDGAGSLIYLGFFTKLFNPGIPLVSIGVEFLG